MNDLQKKMTICFVMILAIAAFVPWYWAREPARQEAAAARITRETITRGAEIFVSNCILCHGKTGDLMPGKNLARTPMDESVLVKVIARGRPGTAMPAFSDEEGGALKRFEITDLVTFVKNWDQPLIESAAAHLPATPAPVSPAPARTTPPPAVKATSTARPTVPPPSPTTARTKPAPAGTTPPPSAGGDAQKGRTAYAGFCAACHGAEAQGALGPAMKGRDAASVRAIVRSGKPPMPAFSAAQLSDSTLEDIGAFLVSLRPSTAPAASPTPVPAATAAPPAATTPPPAPTTPAAKPSPSPITPAPAAATASPETAGKTVYGNLGCAGCHGADAQGGFGPALRGKPPATIKSVVRSGAKSMPAFTPAQISDADLNNLAAYLASLK